MKRSRFLAMLLALAIFAVGFAACDPNQPPAGPETPSRDEITIARALEICAELPDGEKSEERYYIRATVERIDNPTYGAMTLTDSTGSIYVYRACSSDGEKLYSDMEEKPYAGDEVLLFAELHNYNGTYEISNGRILEFTAAPKPDFNEADYTAMTVSAARAAADNEKIKLTGVVAAITYANGRIPSGFYLVDGSASIYVYNDQAAARVKVGNTVTVAGEKTHWILDSESNLAATFGYKGCNQLQNVTLIGTPEGNDEFDKSWIQETTVKNIVDTPVSEDITTNIYKVNALVKKVEGTGFVNYYLNDLDEKTGSYVYTQCNGSDFAWLDAFDGKICTIYLSVINAKSAASGAFWRFFPVAVIDENYAFDAAYAAEFAVTYYAMGQFESAYAADPAKELVASVSSELLGIEGVALSYSSSDNEIVYFENNVMHTKDFGKATVTVTATYGEYEAFSRTVEILVVNPAQFESVGVKAAIEAAADTELNVRGIVGPSLVNKTGFYLIDDDGVIAVQVTEDIMKKVSIGDEVIIKGTRSIVKPATGKFGQSCINGSELLVNYFGNNEYSTASFVSDKTLKDLYDMPVADDHTTQVFVVEVEIIFESAQYYSKCALKSGDVEFELYCSGAKQYSWLSAYSGKKVTVEVALCNWNEKAFYKGCVLAVYGEDGAKEYNKLNFSNK